MEVTIFLVLWTTSHDGNVETGVVPCKTYDEADREMRKLYEQSLVQVEPDGNYGTNEYYSYANYFVESEDGEYWERAEIQSTTIEFDTIVKNINI